MRPDVPHPRHDLEFISMPSHGHVHPISDLHERHPREIYLKMVRIQEL
jgi:hypothetical protein